MNLTEELLLNMGFEDQGSMDTEDKKWYMLYVYDIGFISLRTREQDQNYSCYFHKNKDDEKFDIIRVNVGTLSCLLESILRAIKLESIKIGKESKQEEFKSVLGIK